MAYVASTDIHLAKSSLLTSASSLLTPSFKGELGNVVFSWAVTYNYKSITIEERKNRFERITSSFHHIYNPGNRDPNTGKQQR